MANYATLKAAVADVVKTNGTQAITGANLQAVLLSIINSIGGGGYVFAGVATPSTNPGTPDENVFYIGGAGTYANFGTSVTVPVGSICVFKYNGSWVKEQIDLFAGIDDELSPTATGVPSTKSVYDALTDKSKGFITDNVSENADMLVTSGSVYDFTALKENDSNNLFSVCDGNGNIILKLNSGISLDDTGNLRTSSFNSSNISHEFIDSCATTENDDNNIFSLSDHKGNLLIKVNAGVVIKSDGNIETKSIDTDPTSMLLSQFPKLDVKKENFRWLDIGNSHSLCSLKYLRYLAISQQVDLSSIAFCRMSRGGSSFKTWVDAYHDADTGGGGDALTGSIYNLYKDFGELSVKVSGNTYTEAGGTPTPVTNHELSRNPTQFWGGDASIMRSLFTDNKFDLITIHQRYNYFPFYDSSDKWRDNSEYGYLTEFIRIIKTLQPQASIGVLFSLIPFEYAGSTLEGVTNMHKEYSKILGRFMRNTGIDFIIPCDTALENLRASSVANTPNEGTGASENLISRYGFNYDAAHTAFGVSAYTMSCCAWEAVLAPRYGKSCLGNTYLELKSDDLTYTPTGSSYTYKFMKGSYTNNDNEKVIIDSADGVWNAPQYIDLLSSDGGITWDYSGRALATIRVSSSNAATCQMAAILAVNDMWHVNNPDNINL